MSNADSIKLKVLTAKRETLFQRIQRLYNNSKNLKEKKHSSEFQIRYETLEDTRVQFERIMTEINELSLSMDEEYVPNFQPLEAFDELYCYIKNAAKDVFKFANEQNKDAPVAQSVQMKLPKIELPSFTGVHAEWPIFYETFKSLVHDNPEVDKINKLHYLLGKLSGKALVVCSGITPTAANYDVIWNALVTKYEDKRALANCYMDQLISFKPAQVENAHCLSAFLEKFDSSVKALKNLKIDDLADFMLSYLALSKLDKETAKLFEMSYRKDSQPSYEEVRKFVQEQRKILSLNNQSTSASKSASNGTKPKCSNNQPTRAFMVKSNTQTLHHDNSCPLCNKNHLLFTCEKFVNLEPKDRFKFVKEKSLCFNCLSSVHKVPYCKSKHLCRTCSSRHHSLLHLDTQQNLQSPKIEPIIDTSQNLEVVVPANDTNSFCSTFSSRKEIVLLSTAIVRLILPCGKGYNIRVLIDNASQSNFLTANCCKKLKLAIKPYVSTVSGMGTHPQKISGKVNVVITSRFNTNLRYSFESFVVDRITNKMPSQPVDVSTLDFLVGLPIADDTFASPGEIDGILGAEIFSKIIGPRKYSDLSGMVHAIETSLGYVITGKMQILDSDVTTHAFCSFVEPLHDLVKRFWEIEKVDVPASLSLEEEECEQFFASTYKRDTSGRFIVRLPFRQDPNVLGDSKTVASRRFFALEKRFDASPDLKNAYTNAIREQIDLGYLSKVEKIEPTIAYYLPHHGVFKPESESTPLRIVLDASAKTSTNISLNDILHKGPNLQIDLIAVLLNFRLFEIALTADLKKMFLQILIAPEDRDFLRLLWRSCPDEPVGIFHLNCVGFGLRCSPYLAMRSIKQLALDESQKYPEASHTVLHHVYMDDLVSSVSSLSKARALYAELVQMFKSGGFDLVKWNSNSAEFLQNIHEYDRLPKTLEFEASTSKVLGLQWQSLSDTFQFGVAVRTYIAQRETLCLQ